MNEIGGLLALLGLLLPATASARDPAASHATAAGRQHLLLLEGWSNGTIPDAPRQRAAVEGRFSGSRQATSPPDLRVSPRCTLELDDYVVARVGELGPEGLLPLTLFYLEVFIAHATTDQRWLATEARIRYTSLLNRYSRLSEPSAEARERHSLMLVAIAVRLSSSGYLALIQLGRAAALDAVSLTPQSDAALYWAAFLEEKLGRHKNALDLLARLVEHHDDDPEIRLRRGVNLVRRGKTRAARADFESVARGPYQDSWRILAYQELSQLDPKAGDPPVVAVLDEALGFFPNDPGLRLLASLHGRPVDPIPGGDLAPSPRLLYERASEAALATAGRALMIEVEERLGGLSSTLAEIRGRIESGEVDAKAFRSCRADRS